MVTSRAPLPIDKIGQLRDDFALSAVVILLWVSFDYLEHVVASPLTNPVLDPTFIWRGGDALDTGGSVVNSAAPVVS